MTGRPSAARILRRQAGQVLRLRAGQFVDLADVAGGLARTVAITSATSRASTGDVRPVPNGSRIVPSRAIDSAAQVEEEEVLQEDRRADVDDGQAGPVQRLLGQPVLPLLRRVGRLGQAHLRHGHLRDVDEHLQVAAGRGRPRRR